MKHKLRNDLLLNLPNCEDIWTEVSTNQGSIIFAVIYRHPTTNFQAFENALGNTLTELENQKLRYVVSGDVNINYLAINNQKISNYFNSLNALGSKLLITVPTRFSRYSKPSLLDHIYSNITKTKIIAKPCLFHISDHLPTCIILNRFSVNKKFKSKMKRCVKFFKVEEFIMDLNRQFQNYSDINNQDADVNKDVSRITETFINTLNSHAPLKPMSRREKKLNEKPWISKEILNSIRTKNKLFTSCYKCSEANKIEFYKKYRNKLTLVKFLAKSQYYNNLLTENRSNPQKTWEILRQIIEGKNSLRNKLPTSLEINGQSCKTDSDEFLNRMCEYFAKVGSNLSKNNPSNISEHKIFSKSIMQSFTLHEFTESEVSLAINDVKCNTAPGMDGISPKFVKIARVALAPILTKLYNKCLQQKCFPDEFKVGQVIPIPKT